MIQVSIPFKRESVFKGAVADSSADDVDVGFNSLQTGKCIQSPMCDLVSIRISEFQFPSNGKVYSKKSLNGLIMRPNPSFNSLQTGKCIQSE